MNDFNEHLEHRDGFVFCFFFGGGVEMSLSFKHEGSVRCYVGEVLCGSLRCTWNFIDLQSRQIFVVDGQKRAAYKNTYFDLQGPEKMRSIIGFQLRSGGAVYVDQVCIGNSIDPNNLNPFPFLDVSDPENRAIFEARMKAAE